ncbi:MAG: sigma-70 family RNA polymerase sigma factor [Firmicutes bacterium]|nr:sigma-70 family RNA polymerase sigma factor [Bacillota bacterium]
MEYPPPLSNQEQDEYLKNISSCANARDKLVRHNLFLVARFARSFHNIFKYEFDDYFQEGCKGLISAVNSYNPDRGTFSTWAGTCIHNVICVYIRKFVKEGEFNAKYRAFSLDENIEKNGEQTPRADIETAYSVPFTDRVDNQIVGGQKFAKLKSRDASGLMTQVIAMRHGFDGHSPMGVGEIAQTLGSTRGAINGRQSMAMTIMREN